MASVPFASATAPVATQVDPAGLVELVIRHAPVGMAVIDAAGRYRSVNPAYCAMYGYRAEEMLGRCVTMVFAPAQHELTLSRHREFIRHGGQLRGHREVVRSDGEVFSVNTESIRIEDVDGQASRLVYVVDVSAHKRVQRDLQAAHAFLQSVLDAMPSQVCVLGESGHIVSVNRAWREFAQAHGGGFLGAEEGASCLQACDAATRAGGPDAADAARLADQLRQILSGGLTRFELTCASPPLPMRRWFSLRAVRMPGTGPMRVVLTCDDVTEAREAQETLRQGDALLRDLAAHVPGVLFRLVHHGGDQWRYVYLSPGVEQLFEVTAEQVASERRTLWNLILSEDVEAHDQSIRVAVAHGTAWECAYRVRTASGQIKWIQARANPQVAEDGSVTWTGILNDISERMRLEAVLQTSEETYRTLFETVPQGIVYQDADGRITAANGAAQRILGLTLQQMQGLTSLDPRWHAVHEDGSDFPGDEHPAMLALRTGQPVLDVVMGVARPDGSQVWIQINATPMFAHGQLTQVYSTIEDITQRARLAHELQRQATTDHLTGIANRRSLMERIASEFDRFRRHPELHCTLLALDLDHFKLVNDRWGHAAGDAVLVRVAQCMRETTRQHDVVGRSGGEEFMVLLPDTNADEAMALAERLRARIAGSPVRHADRDLAVTVSIGVSSMQAGDLSADEVMARADRALYRAKHANRNQVLLADASDGVSSAS